jgi:hypothetical protein
MYLFLFCGRVLENCPFAAAAAYDVAAAQHVGQAGVDAVASGLIDVGGTGVGWVGSKAMAPAIIEELRVSIGVIRCWRKLFGGRIGDGGGTSGSMVPRGTRRELTEVFAICRGEMDLRFGEHMAGIREFAPILDADCSRFLIVKRTSVALVIGSWSAA